jgi:enhancing lycopene biosynthesis protein 2
MTKPTFAVVLSGCGVYDGSEIHEAVLTLLAIDRQGGSYHCFAPDIAQRDVIDHLTGQPGGERRNVLAESARIARGKIKPLSSFSANAFDILVFPGGFGAAKNLSSFAIDDIECSVNADVEAAVKAMHAAGKPIVALCIAPALIARVLGGVELTIGNDAGTASALEQMGARHRNAGHTDVVVDQHHKVVSSPCYMLDAHIGQIADGTDAAIRAAMALLKG